MMTRGLLAVGGVLFLGALLLAAPDWPARSFYTGVCVGGVGILRWITEKLT